MFVQFSKKNLDALSDSYGLQKAKIHSKTSLKPTHWHLY